MARLPAKRAKVVMSAIIATNRRPHPKRPSPLKVAATSPMRRANLTSTAKRRIVKLSALDAPIARLAAVADRKAAAGAGAGTVVPAGVGPGRAARARRGPPPAGEPGPPGRRVPHRARLG